MDMLVNLYALPPKEIVLPKGVRIHKAIPFEKGEIKAFVKETFPDSSWDQEIDGGLDGPVTTVHLASLNGKIIGFSAYEVTARGFLGPLGVATQYRKGGIGEVLVRACLLSLKEMGYAYAIIGYVGPEKWYADKFGAMPIKNSLPESVYSLSFRYHK